MSLKLTTVYFECGGPGDKDDIPVREPDVGANESLGAIQGREEASGTACQRVGNCPHCSKGEEGRKTEGVDRQGGLTGKEVLVSAYREYVPADMIQPGQIDIQRWPSRVFLILDLPIPNQHLNFAFFGITYRSTTRHDDNGGCGLCFIVAHTGCMHLR